MPRRKNSPKSETLGPTFDLVSETWSIVGEPAPGTTQPVSGADGGANGISGLHAAAAELVLSLREEEGKQRRALARVLVEGPGTYRLLESAEFARLRIPSPPQCLKLGFIVSYLMPGLWLIADEQWVKNRMVEQKSTVAATTDLVDTDA